MSTLVAQNIHVRKYSPTLLEESTVPKLYLTPTYMRECNSIEKACKYAGGTHPASDKLLSSPIICSYRNLQNPLVQDLPVHHMYLHQPYCVMPASQTQDRKETSNREFSILPVLYLYCTGRNRRYTEAYT